MNSRAGKMHRLAIGTAQFGMPYGIANQQGQASLEEIAKILATAKAAGIDTLDTAIAYGYSEERLGVVGVQDWHIVSKLPKMPQDNQDPWVWVEKSISESLTRLGVEHLYGILLHCPSDLLTKRGESLYGALTQLKIGGKVGKIGISIYDPDELEPLLKYFDFDLVQSPLNIIDRRLVTSGWLAQLKKRSIEVHVRSIFLQGLLLLNSMTRPAQFNPWKELWDFWQEWLDQGQLTPVQACLSFVLSHQEVGRVLVGVDQETQLQEILINSSAIISEFPEKLSVTDLQLINPSMWRK